ncbi:MAG: hypothetical protein Q4D57_04710 [Clostridia bacterium]|nr:hypothetical protein [Clostridia bacterium]
MNKILKIYVKNDPVFKYVVEDYPFYEGIFFHATDYLKMNVLHTHYTFRNRINMGNQTINISENLRLNLHFKPQILEMSTVLNAAVKSNLKSKTTFKDYQKSRFKLCCGMRVQMRDKTCFKSSAAAHLIRMTKLKTHDPFILRNRDAMQLDDMDGEIII